MAPNGNAGRTVSGMARDHGWSVTALTSYVVVGLVETLATFVVDSDGHGVGWLDTARGLIVPTTADTTFRSKNAGTRIAGRFASFAVATHRHDPDAAPSATYVGIAEYIARHIPKLEQTEYLAKDVAALRAFYA